MLAIRMQRTGRKGHAQFRVIVQEARLNPSSGRVVARLGSYDPHTKATVLDKDKASVFLTNGAQPSNRVAQLLKKEGVKLPKWVVIDTKKTGVARNPEKLRANQPKGATPAKAAEPAADEAPADAAEAPAEVAEETNPAEATTADAVPAEEPAATDGPAKAEEAAVPEESAAPEAEETTATAETTEPEDKPAA